MTTEEKIWRYLKGRGLTDAGAAGLMGNLYAESGLNPRNLQNSYERKLGYTDDTYTAAVDNGTYTNFARDSAGYGLAQWTYWTRKQALLEYARVCGRSIGDLEMQLDFLMRELSTGYKVVLATLKTTTNVQAASDAVLLKFERPADQSEAAQVKRAGYGQTYYNKYAKKAKKGEVKMKYTAQKPPMKCFMRQSAWHKNAGKVTVRGVLWHSTGANNPNLRRYVQPDTNAADRAELLKLLGTNNNRNDWNREGQMVNGKWVPLNAGVHAWIGKLANGNVAAVQVGEWDKMAWGCGTGKKGSCNNGWIQFEICEDALTDRSYFEQVYREAVELTAYLCKLYNLNPNGTVTHCGVQVPVILCHQDSYRLGLGSNHGDVLHWLPKYGKSMQTVRDDVAALLDAAQGTTPAAPVGNLPYTVRVAQTGLMIRTGPGTNHNPAGAIRPGVYTIVSEATGQGAALWGKLKSGAGWIALDGIKKSLRRNLSWKL